MSSRSLGSLGATILLLASNLIAAGVDPALVGSWSLQSPGAQLVWQVTADGHYVLTGSLTDSGTIEASYGKWTTTSLITSIRLSGSYSFDRGTLSTVAPTGPAQWKRATGASTDSIPSGLPAMAHNALALLRRNLADAVLTMVEVGSPAPVTHPIEFRFYSRRTGHVYVSIEGSMLDAGPSTGEQALPANFIDLPQAVETARRQGMKGALGNATLLVVNPPKSAPIPVWQVNPQVWDTELARSIHAVDGRPLDTARISPMPGNDAEIAQAAGKLRAALAPQTHDNSKEGAGAGVKGVSQQAARLASCGQIVKVDGFQFLRINIGEFAGDGQLLSPVLINLEPIGVHSPGSAPGYKYFTVNDYSSGLAGLWSARDFGSPLDLTVFVSGGFPQDIIERELRRLARSGCK